MANMTNKAEIIHVRTAISDAASQTSDTATSIRLSCYAANKSIVPSSVLQEDDYSCHTNDFVTHIQSLRHPENQGIINPSTGNFKTGCAKGTDGYDTAYLKGISDELKVYTPSGKYKQGTMQSYTCYAVSDSCTFNTANQLTGITHKYGTCYVRANEGYYNGAQTFTISGVCNKGASDISLSVSGVQLQKSAAEGYYNVAATNVTSLPSATNFAAGSLLKNVKGYNSAGKLITGNIESRGTVTDANKALVSTVAKVICFTSSTTNDASQNWAVTYPETVNTGTAVGFCFASGYYANAHCGTVSLCNSKCVAAACMLSGVKAYNASNQLISGTIACKTAANITLGAPTDQNQGTVSWDAGYYASGGSKDYTYSGLSIIDPYSVVYNCKYIDRTGMVKTGCLFPVMGLQCDDMKKLVDKLGDFPTGTPRFLPVLRYCGLKYIEHIQTFAGSYNIPEAYQGLGFLVKFDQGGSITFKACGPGQTIFTLGFSGSLSVYYMVCYYKTSDHHWVVKNLFTNEATEYTCSLMVDYVCTCSSTTSDTIAWFSAIT